MLRKNIKHQKFLPSWYFVLLLLLTLATWTFAQTTAAPAQPKSQTNPPAAQTANTARKAVITSMGGKSVQFSIDQGKTWQPAKVGVKLGKNALLRTGFASACELNFGSHSIIQIQPLSSIKVADYIGEINQEKVRTTLHYGALRCGVLKGRIRADTKISTPVSTLSIRGTMVYVEYDPGTRRCKLEVDEDGPALARVFTMAGCGSYDLNCLEAGGAIDPRQYELEEGMRTDCALSRYLKLAIFDRTVWVTGNIYLGDITDAEAEPIAYYGTGVVDTGGALYFNNHKSRAAGQTSQEIIEFFGGPIPIGSSFDLR